MKLSIKNTTLISFYLIGVITIIYSFNSLREEKQESFLNKTYIRNVENIQGKLQTLIKEKLNATKTIALGLSENPDIVNSLKKKDPSIADLKLISLNMRNNTNFKNVWFQLISPEGVSLKRSWNEKSGDSLLEAKQDLVQIIKSPKMLATIGVGKFDINLKVIIPIYSSKDGKRKLVGFFETMTHFNSIARKIAEAGSEIIVFANKESSDIISNAFSGNSINDFYIANFTPNKKLLSYLKTKNITEFIHELELKKFLIEEKLHAKISYMPLSSINGRKIGHIIVFSKLKDSETTLSLKTISYTHTIYAFLAFSFWTIMMYIVYSLKEKHIYETSSRKAVIYLMLFFMFIAIMIYQLLQTRYEKEIETYTEQEKNQIRNEYSLIQNKNLELANFIFNTIINKKEVIELFENGKREELFFLLKEEYDDLVKLIHIRQLHFHTSKSDSFLRMHRPNKFGDSLIGIRESVEYVNKHLDIFYGFEEGRIFNGFRHVFPVFNSEDQHIGSVEISFDSLTFIESYLKSFGKKANFLLKKDTVDEKVFKQEKTNYVESPLRGFYYDKEIFGVLEWSNQRFSEFGKSDKFAEAQKKIMSGEITIIHTPETSEFLLAMPILNKVSGKVVATIVISKSDQYILDKRNEFLFTLATLILILIFISIFVYREIILKEEISSQSSRIRRILDSQETIIVITDGKEILDNNRALLEFFNVKDLDEFNHKYGCICHHFEQGFGYLERNMSGETWLDYALRNVGNGDVKVRIKNWRDDIKTFKIEARLYAGKNLYIISLIDISHIEESHIEIKKKSAEQRQLLSLFDIGGISLFRWKNDLNWSVEYLSRNAETLFGYSRTDFLSAKVKYGELIHREDVSAVKNEVQDAIQNNKEFFNHKPYRVKRKDGTYRWVLDYTLIIRNIDGIVTHFLGYIVDITDLKDFEKKARDIKDRFQLAIDGANDGLWDWNIQTDDVYFSPRWKEMIGYEEHEISNSLQEWKSRVHEDDLQKSLHDIDEHLRGITKIYENEHRLRHKDGSWIWILDRGKVLFDENKEPLRMVGFHTDISQKKKYEEKLQKLVEDKTDENMKQWEILQQQSKLAVMGEMMGAIAHQWRQPLNALSINIQELQDDFEEELISEEFIEDFINKNQNIILFMSRTVEDFRNFFKVDKKRILFSVREAIENTVDIQIAQLRSHSIGIEIKGDDFMVNGYRSEFQQVILNLIGNSKDAILDNGKNDGKIEVLLSERAIIVRDNGGGIPEDVLQRIFEPYFTTKSEGQGTGIGLYMSKMIIEDNMDGFIKAQNTDLGAEFIIKI
ncbi:PAS domain S-box [Thiovulum sp. ES]|nr:PAS domain S-box [Thiovulum sp. ES]